jgi:hypothetical protein
MGPRWTESRDAALLREAGAAVGLPERYGPEDPMLALVRAWSGWITNEAARREAGRKGRAVVDAGLGASARCAAVVVKAVEG